MTTPATPTELRVGVVFPAKKIGHLRDILTETRGGVRFVLLDLQSAALATPADVAAALGGRVDVLLHKLAHEMVFARLGDADAARRLRLMVDYVAQHPELVVLDPIDSVTLLTDRQAACDMLVRLRDGSASGNGGKPAFHVPRYHVVDGSEAQHAQLLEAVDAGRLQLPLICKSVDACATDRSHWMSVVTKRDDLVRVEYPALYQEFINHSGRLFKGYVLGELINVVERRSLPNLSRDAQRVHFDTQKQYPSAHDFHAADTAATPAPAPTAVTATATATEATSFSALSQDEIFAAVRAIGVRICETLGLSLFGFDVIVSDATSELYVIDVNYFPSYKELENFGDVLREHIRTTHAKQ